MSLADSVLLELAALKKTYIYGADNGAVDLAKQWGYTSPGVFEQAYLMPSTTS